MNGQDDCLDILGQQPLLKIYTQICLCYSMNDDVSPHASIISTLGNGLKRLSASFPWVAGQVVAGRSEENNSDIYKIKPLESTPRVVVKDVRDDPSIPTMEALRHANFPISMLDEDIFAPRKTLPTPGEASDVWPVFLLQATFIKGGLLLTVNGQHQTMDMTGQGQIMRLLSKACRDEPFTEEELSSGNHSRTAIIPLLDDSYEPGPELASKIVKPPSGTQQEQPSPPPKAIWANFNFGSSSLSALKSLATKTVPSGYISTDDALSAFIWQRIMHARLPRLGPDTKTTFSRAVDVRHYLGIPSTYPGLMQNMTHHTYSVQELLDLPLGVIAANLRSALAPETSTLAHDTRALATFYSRCTDKSAISFTASTDQSTDLMFSSWAKVDCYDLDFGLGLGKPESVRRPHFTPVESLLYLLPRTPYGEIVAAICLREEDMKRLRVDEEFAEYANYIG